MREAGFKRDREIDGNIGSERKSQENSGESSMPGLGNSRENRFYKGRNESQIGHRLEDSAGKWAYIELTTGDQLAGRIYGLDKEVVSFLPYWNFSSSEKDKIPKHYIEHEGDPLSVSRGMIKFSKGYSEQEAQIFCEYANRENYLKSLRREAEINELEQKLGQGDNSKEE